MSLFAHQLVKRRPLACEINGVVEIGDCSVIGQSAWGVIGSKVGEFVQTAHGIVLVIGDNSVGADELANLALEVVVIDDWPADGLTADGFRDGREAIEAIVGVARHLVTGGGAGHATEGVVGVGDRTFGRSHGNQLSLVVIGP